MHRLIFTERRNREIGRLYKSVDMYALMFYRAAARRSNDCDSALLRARGVNQFYGRIITFLQS